ncbi:cadherin repeat domain-containing protein [uncultured Croceitalea sp.]|uniref:cadherin repeat domain-containing protein n=1 Tax=uncultured Croceitalea sp. TaxID=1798908 RepID=UPI003305D2CC
MKTIYVVVLLCGAIILNSCSKDDNQPFSLSSVNVTITENPESGDLLGKVGEGNSSDFTFSITSSSPPGAFKIDAQTGQMYVADKSLFDYEQFIQLSASISATNGTETTNGDFTVALENIDDILFYLNDAKQAYENANQNEWVEISAADYASLRDNLYQVSVNFAASEDYNTPDSEFQFVGNRTIENGERFPNNEYVFAIKYGSLGVDVINGAKIKINNSENCGSYTNLGTTLPIHEPGLRHFVLKQNTVLMNGNERALTIYSPAAIAIAPGTSYSSYYSASGDQNQITCATSSLRSGVALFTSLGTSVKQW